MKMMHKVPHPVQPDVTQQKDISKHPASSEHTLYPPLTIRITLWQLSNLVSETFLLILTL